jgi:DNA polymerase-3 subunit epsilon
MSGKVRFALAAGRSWGVVVPRGAPSPARGADLGEAERALLARILRERRASLTLAALLLLVPLRSSCAHCVDATSTAPAKLVEDAQIMLAANPSHRATASRLGRDQRLAAAQRLADVRESLLRDVEARVREANERIEQERNRLAALMSELATA